MSYLRNKIHIRGEQEDNFLHFQWENYMATGSHTTILYLVLKTSFQQLKSEIKALPPSS